MKPKHWNPIQHYACHNSSCQVTPELIDRLGLESELEGHDGCVNCIDWNYNGMLLATGSDDRTVIVWNPHIKKSVANLRTQHTNNIFSVKFIPEANDRLIATAAGDNRVSVIDLTRNETTMLCSCHLARVKGLAVSRDNPFLLWSGSEDGTVRQIDLRESHRCSDRTSDILINLLVHCGKMAEIKSLAANPVRSELLAVGVNDPYARLYDRRMTRPYSCKVEDWSTKENPLFDRNAPENKNLLPVGCATYFVPGHIPFDPPDKQRARSLAATHVTFDPSGQKLLVNLGGEQIYLFDVFEKELPAVLSVAKIPRTVSSPANVRSQDLPLAAQLLKAQANAAFDKSQYNLAVDLYNEALQKCPQSALLLSNKSAALMKRKWAGDVYSALRDSLCACGLDPMNMKAHYRVARCLIDLGRPVEADEAVHLFEEKFPGDSEVKWFTTLKDDLAKLRDSVAKKQTNGHNGSPMPEEGRESQSRTISLANVSLQSLMGKKNLSDIEKTCRENAFDYEQRFCGHCNTTTDIKQANFFGGDGQYVVAGSDDGSFFVWDRETTNIVRILKGDDSVVNCLQPHPTTCLLATSGIDSVVRLWRPMPEDFINDRLVTDASSAALANQRRMASDPLHTLLLSMHYNVPDDEEEGEEGAGAPPTCRTS